MDFAKIKEIPILAVCGKYGIKLRFNGEWGSALCPLPSHKQGEKDKTFQVSVRQNYFKCWSTSCNEKAGCKGGDVINFVALMENCSQYDAAKRLAQWFHIDEKTAEHIARRPEGNQKPQKDLSDNDKSSEKSNGFLHETGLWLDELLGRVIGDDVIRKTVKKALMQKIHGSYLAGKKLVV